MLRKHIFSSLRFFILFLLCGSFLRGQTLNSVPNAPFQNCWELSERLAHKIASDNKSKIFMPISFGLVKAIDINKKEIWNIDLGGEIITQPIYLDETLYVLARVNNPSGEDPKDQGNVTYFISSVSTESGIARWRKEYKSKLTPRLFLHKDKLIIVLNKSLNRSSKHSSNFIVLDGNTGNVWFEKSFDFSIEQSYNIFDGNILMLTSTNSIVSFSILDGEITSFNSSIENIQTGAVYSKGIILSDDRGIVYLINSDGKESKLKTRFGAKVTNVAFYNDRFLISSLDNFIYSVSLDGKHINWKKRLPGRIIDKPIISQNTVIAFSQGDSSLYFINFDDGKVFNRITVPVGEEIIGSPATLNNFVIVTTSKGIRAYTFGNCKKFTAARK